MSRVSSVPVLVTLAGLSVACGTTVRHDLSIQSELALSRTEIRRVAVVPSRLPLMVEDADYWRRSNWVRVASLFRERGFEVPDYETSVAASDRWGPKFEDIAVSGGRIARFASELDADAVVVPSYAISSGVSLWLVLGRARHDAVATFQVYLADGDAALARIDAAGQNQYSFGGIVALGAVVTAAGAWPVGVPIMALGAVVDLFQATVPKRERWGKAFDRAIAEGLEPFIAALERPPPAIAALGPGIAGLVEGARGGLEDGRVRLDFRLALRGLKDRSCCAAALFEEDGIPLRGSGTYSLHGRLAVSRRIVPRSDFEHQSVVFSLPVGELGFQGRRAIGRHEVVARVMVWSRPCGSVQIGDAALARSQPISICVRKLAAGYTSCD